MPIEHVVCPCCNDEFRVNLPIGRDIEEVFTAATIISSLVKKHDQRLLCPSCGITVFIRLSKPMHAPAQSKTHRRLL